MRSEKESAQRVSRWPKVALLVDLDHPLGEAPLQDLQVLLGLGQLGLVVFGGRLGLAQLGLGVVVVLDGGVELLGQFVDARLQSLGLALGLGDGGRLSRRDLAAQQKGQRQNEEDGDETPPDAA